MIYLDRNRSGKFMTEVGVEDNQTSSSPLRMSVYECVETKQISVFVQVTSSLF